jgi:hypothetical protein
MDHISSKNEQNGAYRGYGCTQNGPLEAEKTRQWTWFPGRPVGEENVQEIRHSAKPSENLVGHTLDHFSSIGDNPRAKNIFFDPFGARSGVAPFLRRLLLVFRSSDHRSASKSGPLAEKKVVGESKGPRPVCRLGHTEIQNRSTTFADQKCVLARAVYKRAPTHVFCSRKP